MSHDGGLVDPIINLLAMHGIWAWRTNSGAIHTERGSFVQLAPAGTPDIIGARPVDGKLFGIECKSRTGRLNANQRAWRARAAKNSVLYYVVRSIGDAHAIAKELER